MAFALKTASFSKKKSIFNHLGIKGKDPEVDSYIQSLMHRILELESEVTSLRSRLDECEMTRQQRGSRFMECKSADPKHFRPSCVSDLIQEEPKKQSPKFTPSSKLDSAVSDSEPKAESKFVPEEDMSYVIRTFNNSELHKRMKEEMIKRMMLCEPEEPQERPEIDHSLSNFDPAKVSNLYYEVSETERRDVELIVPQKEPNTEEEFKIVLIDSMEFDDHQEAHQENDSSPYLNGLHSCKDETTSYKTACDRNSEPEPRESDRLPIRTSNQLFRHSEDITSDPYNQTGKLTDQYQLKKDISFDNESEGLQMEVMTSKYVVKDFFKEGYLPTHSSNYRHTKANFSSNVKENHIKDKSCNKANYYSTVNCGTSELSREKAPREQREGHSKENQMDYSSKRKSLAKKFSHVSSQLRNCFQRRPLDSDLFLQDRLSKSKSRFD
jgi:hypothetical protein